MPTSTSILVTLCFSVGNSKSKASDPRSEQVPLARYELPSSPPESNFFSRSEGGWISEGGLDGSQLKHRHLL